MNPFRCKGVILSEGLCAYCKEKSTLSCKKCGEFYCSKDHQVIHWKVHKKTCTNKYYKVFQEASQPICLVASKDIRCSTVIIESQAIAVGTGAYEPVCLGCLRPMIWDVMSFQCEDCGWPVCGIDCQRSEMHQLECKAFQSVGFKFNKDDLRKDWRLTFPEIGCWLLILRVLLSEKVKKLLNFDIDMIYRDDLTYNVTKASVDESDYLSDESKIVLKFYEDSIRGNLSSEVLTNTSLKADAHFWNITRNASFPFFGINLIRRTWKLQQFEADDILKAYGAIGRCSVSLNYLHDHIPVNERRAGIAVFASDISYFDNSCCPNLDFQYNYNSLKNPPKVEVLACKDILAGEKLSVYRGNRCPPCINSTYSRQIHREKVMLKVPCNCQRCSDPSELNLNMSSFKCQNCCRGLLMPKDTSKILVTDWVCKSCKYLLKGCEYSKLLGELKKDLGSAVVEKNKLLHLEKFIETHTRQGGALHETHELIIQAKRMYCVFTYNDSVKTGAAYKFDSQVLEKLEKYVQDYKLFHVSLNSNIVLEDILLNTVLCKNTIYKLDKGEISKEQAKLLANNFKGYYQLYSMQGVLSLKVCKYCSADFASIYTDFFIYCRRLYSSLIQ